MESSDQCSSVIVVHGGAGNVPDKFAERFEAGIQRAARAGYQKLFAGGSAVDAVCAAVCVLEEDDVFNAGKGSVFTEHGTIEMDAFVMDGATLKTGAVSCVQFILHPVLLARDVMEKTDHCFLTSHGASLFAKKVGHPILESNKALLAEEEVFKLKYPEQLSFEQTVDKYVNNVNCENDSHLGSQDEMIKKGTEVDDCHDTVGAVALDVNGKIACATSTGGLPNKMVGRVGDSPLIGCGSYANELGGACSTGHGEAMLRTMVCREAVYNMQNGLSVQEAAEKALNFTLSKTGGRGGLIAIDKNRNVGIAFTSKHMTWAYIKDAKLHFGVYPGDDKESSL